MPIQVRQWTDFLLCSVCCKQYSHSRLPVTLGCSHTICKECLLDVHQKKCPFDKAEVRWGTLPINYALLQLVSPRNDYAEEKSITTGTFGLRTEDLQLYNNTIERIKLLASFLKPFPNADSDLENTSVLSRPLQKRLVTLISCQILEPEGRCRAVRASRSLGERTVLDLIIQHQNSQQLSTNLWSAVRAKGCQFLGPAVQEEILKLVLLALEDGSALSRKVLVMFVVQRLEPHFPQVSRTSIGHVVQLLYRASCFVVHTREKDSSLMQLKEEFRNYDALRREHDAQIVEIAAESGLKIAPSQWSSLLYGDTGHKSHMQSIIDKLQTPESFMRSIQELIIALQRTGDPNHLFKLRPHLDYLASLGGDNNEVTDCSMEDTYKAVNAAFVVMTGLVDFLLARGRRKSNDDTEKSQIRLKYKIILCRDIATRGVCPRGSKCTFAHSREELIKYRAMNRNRQVERGVDTVESDDAEDPTVSDMIQKLELRGNRDLFNGQDTKNEETT